MSNKCIKSIENNLCGLNEPKNWYTTREAAEMLGVSSQYVRNLIATGQLPASWAQCLGEKKFYKINRSDLVIYMAEQPEGVSGGVRDRIESLIIERLQMAEIKGIYEHLGKYLRLNS